MSKKRPAQIETPLFSVLTPSGGKAFQAFGRIVGIPSVVHRVEATRIPPGAQYKIESSQGLAVEKLASRERSSRVVGAIERLGCIPTGVPTHLIQVEYVFLRDGTRVVLFSGCLNFEIPGRSSDHIARACCSFASSLIEQKYTRAYRLRPLKVPQVLITANLTSKTYWLAVLATRFCWELF